MTDQVVNQNQVLVDDPWASSENPVFRAAEYFGQINIDTWYCVLEKGTGKIQFDPKTHSADARRTAIDMVLNPLAELNISFEVSRSLVAESADWAKIVLPSIKQFGLSPRELNGKWVKLQFKGTGRKYTNRDGEEKENTTFEFLKLYQSEAECRADYSGDSGAVGGVVNSVSANLIGSDDKEKTTALAFLKSFVEVACKNNTELDKIRATVSTNISGTPLLAKYFTVDSAEVTTLIANSMGK